jgi:hypothetical protein
MHRYGGRQEKPPNGERTEVQGKYTGLHHKDGGLKLPTMLVRHRMARSSTQQTQQRDLPLTILFQAYTKQQCTL